MSSVGLFGWSPRRSRLRKLMNYKHLPKLRDALRRELDLGSKKKSMSSKSKKKAA